METGFRKGPCANKRIKREDDSRKRHRALVPEFLLMPDLKLPLDPVNIGQRWQSGLVAEALDLVGRRRARELKMMLPVFFAMGEIRIDIGAMEDIARAVGIDDAVGRDRQRRQDAKRAHLVVPKQAALAHGDAAEAAAAAIAIVEH